MVINKKSPNVNNKIPYSGYWHCFRGTYFCMVKNKKTP